MATDNKRLNLHGLDYFYHQLQFDSSKIKYNTTAYWNSHSDLIPPQGTIVVYSDARGQVGVNHLGEPIYEPDMKICDGRAYLIDQPFINEDLRKIVMAHLESLSHLQEGEREFWNHKIDVDDGYEQVHDELQNETLVLTRDNLL